MGQIALRQKRLARFRWIGPSLAICCLASGAVLADTKIEKSIENRPPVPPEIYLAYADSPRREVEVAYQGSRLMADRQYEIVLELLRQFSEEAPHSILPSMATMFVHHVRMLENFDFRYWKEFQAAEEINMRILKDHFREEEAGRWDLLMAGGSLGLRGMMQARRQHWLKAARLGMEAMSVLKRAPFESKHQPPLYDLLYATGMYKYWMTWSQQRSLILSMFPDRKEEALRDLALCSEKAVLTGPLAAFALGYFYMNEGRNAQAVAYVKPLVEKNPRNLIYRSLLGRALLADRRVEEGIRVLDPLLREHAHMTYAGLFLARALAFEGKDLERRRALLESEMAQKDVSRTDLSRDTARFLLAEVNYHDGRQAEAKNELRTFSARNLTSPERQRFLDLQKRLGLR